MVDSAFMPFQIRDEIGGNNVICPHCNMSLPEGLIMCFHCGNSLNEPPIPEPVTQVGAGLESAAATAATTGVAKGVIVAACAVVVVCGGLLAAHFTDLITLPFLPERAATNGDILPSASETPETQPEVTEAPEATTQGTLDSTQSPTDDSGQPGASVLNRFGYTNLTYTFGDFPPDWQGGIASDAVGVLHYDFTITGNTAEIAGVFHSSMYYSWTDDLIAEFASINIPLWQESGHPLQADTQSRQGGILTIYDNYHPSAISELLFFVVNINWEPIGHIIIPVMISGTSQWSTETPGTPTPQALPDRSVIMPTELLDPTSYNHVHEYISIVDTSATPAGFGGYDLSVTLSNPLQAVTFHMYFMVVPPHYSGLAHENLFEHEILYDEFIVENFTMARNSTQTFTFHIPARVMENDNVRVLLYTVDGW